MKHVLARVIFLALAAFAVRGTAWSATVVLGFVAFNDAEPPMAEVDITNATGSNASAFPDNTFPAVTPVGFTDLTLTVSTLPAGTPAQVFGPDSGYFTLAADGLSYNGEAIFPYENSSFIQPGDVFRVTVTGRFATTVVTLNDGSTVEISPTFTARIFGNNPGEEVSDGNFGLVEATTIPFTATPEPGTWVLVLAGTALFGLVKVRSGFLAMGRTGLALAGVCWLGAWLLPATASGAVHLNVWTTPDSGVAGSSVVWVTGSGFPSQVSSLSVTLAPSCGATEGAHNAVPGVVNKVFGSAMKVQFALPLGLSAGTYYAQLSGTETGGTAFSSDCAMVNVQAAAPQPMGCSITSDILAGSSGTPGKIPVTAYVATFIADPGGRTNGIILAPIEGDGSPAFLATTTLATQCVANSASGQVLCAVWNTNPCSNDPQACAAQHLIGIEGSKIVWTGADDAEISRLAINSATNQVAYFSSSFFYINPDDFGSYIDLEVAQVQSNATSFTSLSGDAGSASGFGEIVFDPASNQVFSATSAFGSTSVLLQQFLGGASPRDFLPYGIYNAAPIVGEYTTIGEDCASHQAVSIHQNSFGNGPPTNELVFDDLANASFMTSRFITGTVWSAPSQTVPFSEFSFLNYGAIVASKNHLGILQDGNYPVPNRFGALLLSPEGGLADYAIFQASPSAMETSTGYINTYTSPNNGKDYAVAMFVRFVSPPDGSFVLGVIDLKAALAAPRTAGTHLVQAGYDLVKNGVVRYISVPPVSTLPAS